MNLARYTSPFSNPWAVIGESLLLPVLAVALGIWLNPLDPLWTDHHFPWVWFAPMILALRYGPLPGLAGAALLFIAWLAFSWGGWIAGELPKLFFLGGLIVVMLCGEFSSLWVARARRAESVQVYLDQRLDYLTHQYYLLRLSHDRLEQDLISRPMAMRDALTTLRQLAANETAEQPLAGGAALLRLLAQYCQLETAALFAARGASGTVLDATPVASLGQAGPLVADDPLLAHAREHRGLWHVEKALAAGSIPTHYVIAAPLVTFDGQWLGILLVERVPFFALHEEMLQTLNLLLAYYTDGLVTQRLAAPVRARVPATPPDFASELARLVRVCRDSGIASTLVGLEFRRDQEHLAGSDLPEQIQRQRRALDVNWRIDTAERIVLLTLMPLAGEAAAEGYFARIELWVRQQLGVSLAEAGIFCHVRQVDATAAPELLTQMLHTCHAADHAADLRADA